MWISPLLTFLWFFGLKVVLDTHLFAAHLQHTKSIGEVTMLVDGLRKSVSIRGRERIPI